MSPFMASRQPPPQQIQTPTSEYRRSAPTNNIDVVNSVMIGSVQVCNPGAFQADSLSPGGRALGFFTIYLGAYVCIHCEPRTDLDGVADLNCGKNMIIFSVTQAYKLGRSYMFDKTKVNWILLCWSADSVNKLRIATFSVGFFNLGRTMASFRLQGRTPCCKTSITR
jgi:hypothetical protein